MAKGPSTKTLLRGRAELSERVLEHFSAAVAIVDTNKVVQIFNAAAQRLTGIAAAQAIGQSFADLHPAFLTLDRSHVIDRTLQLGVPGEMHDIRVALKRSARKLSFDFIVDPVIEQGGRIVGASIMAVDVTDVVKLRERLARQNEDLVIMHRVSNVLRSTMDVYKGLFIICTALTSVGSAANDHAMVFLVDERGRELRGRMATATFPAREVWRVWHDLTNQQRSLDGVLEADHPEVFRHVKRLSRIVGKIAIPLGETRYLLSQVVRTRRTMTHEDLTAGASGLRIHERLARFFRMTSFAAMPLLVDDEVIGVLVANSSLTPRRYGVESIKMLEMFADQAALAINNGLMYRRVAERAQRDSLTGLFNHGHFQSRLLDELDRSVRYGDPISLLFFDIDHFKRFNDTWGHQTGDQVLVNLAKLLESMARGTDTCARYGGEEFAVILPRSRKSDALPIAERLRASVEAAVLASSPEGERLPVTISIGIATFPEDAREAPELIRLADEALYAAKHAGRNRVCVAGKTGA